MALEPPDSLPIATIKKKIDKTNHHGLICPHITATSNTTPINPVVVIEVLFSGILIEIFYKRRLQILHLRL